MFRLLIIPLALLALLAGAMAWSGGGGVAKPADKHGTTGTLSTPYALR